MTNEQIKEDEKKLEKIEKYVEALTKAIEHLMKFNFSEVKKDETN